MSFDHRFLRTHLDSESYAAVLGRLTPTNETSQAWRMRMALVGFLVQDYF
jgi:hypothetical protein